MRGLVSVAALAVLLVCCAVAAGCSAIWGFDDLTLAKGPSQGHEGGTFLPVPDSGDASCVPDDPADCTGRCGTIEGRCGGTVTCAPCAGGMCNATSCASGCCSASGACALGTQSSACGTEGATCSICSTSQTCTAGSCVTPSSNVSSSVILFGGQGAANGTFFGDTWAFDGTSWTQVAIPGPVARGAACMATLGNAVVLFGGYDGTNYRNDTWVFDGSAWTQVNVSGPPPRTFGAMTALGDEAVLFGGYNGTTTLNDTWIFNGSTWRQVNASNPPRARQDPNLATLDASQILMFGGSAEDGTAQTDTWTFDGNDWNEQQPNAGSPSGRTYAAMATLGVNSDQVVLFGGDDGTNMSLGDTWVGGPNGQWAEQLGLSMSPPGRTLGAMGSLATSGSNSTAAVLFGGDDANGDLLGDTWVFTGSNWSQATSASAPVPRDGPSMAFLP